MRLRINNVFQENSDQIGELFRQPGIFPNTVEVGISLENMQVRVRSLFFVDIPGAEPQIFKQFPFPAVCLKVSIATEIKTLILNEMKESNSLIQTISVGGSPVTFR
jgi:hypothetical protein